MHEASHSSVCRMFHALVSYPFLFGAAPLQHVLQGISDSTVNAGTIPTLPNQNNNIQELQNPMGSDMICMLLEKPLPKAIQFNDNFNMNDGIGNMKTLRREGSDQWPGASPVSWRFLADCL